ncbi:MAG: ABC transporter permease subunit, partial [bacterium]
MFCIIRRECIGILRQRKSFYQLGLLLGILSLVFIFGWHDGLGGYRPADLGRNIFISIAFAQLIFLLALGSVASQSISNEHERETWDLMLSTPMHPWKIILGKLFSSVFFILLAYTALLPILALCFLMGGLSPRELTGTYMILGGSAFLVASCGIFCSSLTRRSMSAMWMSICLLVFYSILLPFVRPLLVKWITSARNLPGPPFESLISPVFSMLHLFYPAGWIRTNPHIVFLLICLPVCAILLILAERRVLILEPMRRVRSRLNRRFPGIQLKRRIARGIPDFVNPVLAKERILRATHRFARPTRASIAFLGGGLLLGVLLCSVESPPPGETAAFGISALLTLIVIGLLSSVTP